MQNIIEAKNITKIYYRGKYRVDAVKSVNLTIEKGKRIAIIGPSGAGKSTLLHMLGGLDTPTAGSVVFEGSDIYNLSERKRAAFRNRSVGFIFQFYHLLPEFTALENVLMPGIIGHHVTKSPRHQLRKRAELLLGRMDLTHRLNHKPGELSGGEAQRVAIARALINEPKVLFCDEPTGNLDSEMGDMIYGILYEISREKNMSLVVVTHQKRPFIEFDSVHHIKDGRLSEKELKAWV